jgi:hypothetical protein
MPRHPTYAPSVARVPGSVYSTLAELEHLGLPWQVPRLSAAQGPPHSRGC